jgi:uncharacterized protein YyaL (SSP411 family)
MVIIRGPAHQLKKWRDEIRPIHYPHHLFFYLDEAVKNLPATLHRNLADDVNAWVCKGVVCSQSIDNLRDLLDQIKD